MSEETHVVTAFLRHDGEVLLLRRSDAVGTYQGDWGGVSGYAEGDPESQVETEIDEETGIGEAERTLVRTGNPLRVVDDDLDRTWVVHPFLFDVTTREVTTSEEHDTYEWVSPTAMFDRGVVPELWATYGRVAPSVRSVTADDEHGASYLSIRALEVLRDRAATLVGEAESDDDAWDELADLGQRLCRARPSMAVLRNRVNRVLAAADRTAASVLDTATDGIHRAVTADTDAAVRAGALVSDRTVLTLSRSGTVIRAFAEGSPEEVYVAVSEPGGEGVDVAEALVDDGPVTLLPDAAVAQAIVSGEVDAVLVGADTILPDGTVVNKVGTRTVAVAAAHEEVPCYVVAATDKIHTEPSVNVESGRRSAVYDGDAPLSMFNPVFDETPAHLVDAFVTERGELDPGEVDAVADELSALADWRD
ncbi:NUDIX domain-containing protein [Haloarchaeobius iranensis]|uniref:Translation initiation factor 2B subunit, eIF-2B alpha/beta/delta family n=1 Tax=Haloarchaeobius iranensis TaxID=996166 RepID=A0A1G9XSK9_9EURY|nr:NUDIX domain-containing protein [Haloarchaeobius iranensis]SDM99243.1 Translation initiation factor 2B subunit, eIF-2B alpha/beta/delta family [Haloarchaeobius iranensis]